MKKILIAASIIIGAIVLSELGYDLYKGWSLKNEIKSYPDYYRILAEDCKSKGSRGCCIASVRAMKNGNFRQSPESGCPEGFRGNMLKCIDSYRWCEPAE